MKHSKIYCPCYFVVRSLAILKNNYTLFCSMKKVFIYQLLIVLVTLLSACEKSDEETIEPEPNLLNDTLNLVPLISIEKQFGITDPYFYTGLFNGVRITYQTDSRNFIQAYSTSQTSSHGGNTGMSSGFFSHFMLNIWHEHGFYGIPSTTELLKLNHYYSARSFTSDPNDTLHFSIHYDTNGENYRSDIIDNTRATFVIDSFLPRVSRSGPQRDIFRRMRARVDSLYLRGSDTILITDLILQSPIE